MRGVCALWVVLFLQVIIVTEGFCSSNYKVQSYVILRSFLLMCFNQELFKAASTVSLKRQIYMVSGGVCRSRSLVPPVYLAHELRPKSSWATPNSIKYQQDDGTTEKEKSPV